MSSSTKENILEKHGQNRHLNTPLPPIAMTSANDLSADDLAATLDEAVIVETVAALRAGNTHYVNVPGIGPLREAAAAYLNETTGTAYEIDNIVITAGVQESRFLTLQKISEQFEHIGVPAVVHPGVQKALGVRPRITSSIPVDLFTSSLSTIDSLQKTVANGARLLYLESPSRLTGAAYSADEVAEIAALVAEHDIAVIWDMGLAPWMAAGRYTSLASQPGMGSRVALVGELWPGAGIASWLMGYIAAPVDWVPPMQSQKQIMAICTSTPSQYAALEIGKTYAEAQAARIDAHTATRAELVDLAGKAGFEVLHGDVATIVALKVPTEKKAALVTTLDEAGYATADGATFGATDVLRLNVTDAALAALKLLR